MTKTMEAMSALAARLNEAVVLAEDGLVGFMNQAAVELVGQRAGEAEKEAVGKAALLKPGESARVKLDGCLYLVQAHCHEGVRIYLFVPERHAASALVPDEAAPRREIDEGFENAGRLVRGVCVDAYERMTGHASATEKETLDQLLRLARQTALLDRLTRGRILLDSLLNGTYQTELAELDALEFVRGLADSAGLLTERHGISVETNYAPGEELRAVFDLKLVETALLHLMCNALEHMRPGCTLLLEARAEEDGGVRFVVSDNGAGMLPVQLANLYTRDKLGMRLAAAAASAHGGQLAVTSMPARGAHIAFTIPKLRGPLRSLTPEQAALSGGGMYKILVQLSPWLSADDFDPRLMD